MNALETTTARRKKENRMQKKIEYLVAQTILKYIHKEKLFHLQHIWGMLKKERKKLRGGRKEFSTANRIMNLLHHQDIKSERKRERERERDEKKRISISETEKKNFGNECCISFLRWWWWSLLEAISPLK